MLVTAYYNNGSFFYQTLSFSVLLFNIREIKKFRDLERLLYTGLDCSSSSKFKILDQITDKIIPKMCAGTLKSLH